MLERTVGCLESGRLRRLLPSSKQALKSRRTLHSGFWNHAAGENELSPLWVALVRGADALQREVESSPEHSRLDKCLLLDFLYPAGTINLVRQYTGWGRDKSDNRWAKNGLAKLGQRLYSSSARDPFEVAQHTKALDERGDMKSAPARLGKDILQRQMGLTRPGDFEEAWRQYLLLERVDQDRVRNELMKYFSQSKRVLDAERTINLFESVKPEERIAEMYQMTIRAHLGLRNLDTAVSLYETSMSTFQYPAGASELLAYYFTSFSSRRSFEIYSTIENLYDKSMAPGYDVLKDVSAMPNFVHLVCTLVYKARNPTLKPRDRKAWDESEEEVINLNNPREAQFLNKLVWTAILKKGSFHQGEFRHLWSYMLMWPEMSEQDFELVTRVLLVNREKKLFMQCYQQIRNKVRGLHINTLNYLATNYSASLDTKGLEQVMEDFRRFRGRPSKLAYMLGMKMYANLGEVNEVYRLFGLYNTDHVSEECPMEDPDMLSSILHVHSKVGQVDKVVQTFKDISQKYGLEPTIMSWNILISAYGKLHKYDEAFASFGELLESSKVRPDEYTIGTLMGLCINRGDFERVMEIYQLADDLGVAKNATHMSCLVHAYIQEGRIEEAEEICLEAARMNLDGRRVQMWNNLIVGYAFRRDLKSANRIHNLMSSLEIENDEWTYAALMQALTMAGQPNDAGRILKEVLPAAGYEPTAFHYAILMGGFVANREHEKVFKLFRHLQQHEHKITTTINFRSLQARGILDETEFEKGYLTEDQLYQRTLRMLLYFVDNMNPKHVVGAKGMRRDPLDIAYPTTMYRYVISVFVASNKNETAMQLFERYQNALPKNRQGELPLPMISVLAFAKWRERDVKGVEECWHLAVAVAKQGGSSLPTISSYWEKDDSEKQSTSASNPPEILPKHKTDLDKILNIYMVSLSATYDVDKMIIAVNNLLKDGFELDMRNWNIYIALLIRRDRPKLAFEICENKLMPHWTGWGFLRRGKPVRNKLPLEIRALRKNNRFLRPQTKTLLYLTRAYLNIQAAAAESKAYQYLLADLERLFPLTMLAIKTMKRQDTYEERSILGTEY